MKNDIELINVFKSRTCQIYTESQKKEILRIMKDTCQQVIQLAAENATIKYEPDIIVDKQSILNTIKQIK
jgi:hypothetical protein